ncbi:DUF4191 family protein [Cellulosimicrobium sp. BIT-GX5]|uniref:DUF4191 family protein n=1 Tax=Cellulosimicrobium composti TaxID=2672572 RepID=A0A6N7ZK27_9MICO|nr:DUF4191 domain-containing protein [Cellulosimicrobium composti]MTG89700.1 DUF4191 family protein [Cellulosimicrobium composti]
MARKNSDSTGAPAGEQVAKQKKPKKQRWYHQVWAAYQMTRKQDPAVTWVMLAVFVGILVVALGIGLWWGQWVYTLIVGLPFAALGAMFVLTRRAERAAYQQIESQPGASRAALGTIRRGWTFDEEPVAIDPRTQDLVFRGVGRAGVVLVSEGPAHRAKRQLEAERKRVARVLPNVPITLIQVGDDEGQVALPKLPRTVQKLKPTLTKPETAEVSKRLRALGVSRLPIPKGIDPTRARPDRKGLKGR